jgi:two-component system, NarL family, sensor kinase
MPAPLPGTLLRRTLGRHVLVTLLVALVVAGLTVVGIWRYAEDDARRSAEKVARQIASAVLVPLAHRDFRRPAALDRGALLDDLAPFLDSGMIEQVKVLTVDAGRTRIAFSHEQRLEGGTGTLRPDLAARLDRAEVVVQPVPDDPEHAEERGLPGERLEVYLPFRDAAGEDTLLEVYVPVSVGETTRHAAAVLLPIVLAGLLLVALATVPLSVALARHMERHRAEQRAVRRYGLAAAELARRDLARRLHDGVIPRLAGASLLLEAVHAERLRPGADTPWDLIGRVQDLVADDVRRLRTLLDELVPAAVEPEAALRELVEQLRRTSAGSGPVVEIDVADDHGLSDDAAELVVRVAGELLRNAFRHARARSVGVVLAPAGDGLVELTVVDDGVGFDPSVPRRTGHVGLRLVQQVVLDSGGRAHVDSRPGAGTTVRVAIPRQARVWRPTPAAAGDSRPGPSGA